MAMVRNWFRLAAITAAILLAGCSTDRYLVREDASPASLTRLVANGGGDATLVDGAIVRLLTPTDYGDALCSNWACVRKSEVVSIRRWQDSLSLDPTPALAVASLPIVLPVFAVLAAGLCDGQCGAGGEAPPPRPKFEEAPEDWLGGGGAVPDDCKPALEAMPAAREEALDFVTAQRFALSMDCLWIVSNKISHRLGGKEREVSLRLWALRRIRSEWIDEHCLFKYGRKPMFSRISPTHAGYPPGSPSPFPIISETLQDDATYDLPGGLAANCEAGVRPAEEAVDRATFATIVDPFSRPDVHPNVFNDDPLP